MRTEIVTKNINFVGEAEQNTEIPFRGAYRVQMVLSKNARCRLEGATFMGEETPLVVVVDSPPGNECHSVKELVYWSKDVNEPTSISFIFEVVTK